MSAKEQLLTMIDLAGENEASQILEFVKETFALKIKSWDDIEEDEPLPDEVAAFAEYRAGNQQ